MIGATLLYGDCRPVARHGCRFRRAAPASARSGRQFEFGRSDFDRHLGGE